LPHANRTRHPGQIPKANPSKTKTPKTKAPKARAPKAKASKAKTPKAKHLSLIVLFRLVVFRLQHVHVFLKNFRLAAHPTDNGFMTTSRAPKGHYPER
jgi:hypothetical protein